jgi:hypothetical protein
MTGAGTISIIAIGATTSLARAVAIRVRLLSRERCALEGDKLADKNPSNAALAVATRMARNRDIELIFWTVVMIKYPFCEWKAVHFSCVMNRP